MTPLQQIETMRNADVMISLQGSSAFRLAEKQACKNGSVLAILTCVSLTLFWGCHEHACSYFEVNNDSLTCICIFKICCIGVIETMEYNSIHNIIINVRNTDQNDQ